MKQDEIYNEVQKKVLNALLSDKEQLEWLGVVTGLQAVLQPVDKIGERDLINRVYAAAIIITAINNPGKTIRITSPSGGPAGNRTVFNHVEWITTKSLASEFATAFKFNRSFMNVRFK